MRLIKTLNVYIVRRRKFIFFFFSNYIMGFDCFDCAICREHMDCEDYAVCSFCEKPEIFNEEGKLYCDICIQGTYHDVNGKFICDDCGNKNIEDVEDEELKEIIKTRFSVEKRISRLGNFINKDMKRIKKMQDRMKRTNAEMNKLLEYI